MIWESQFQNKEAGKINGLANLDLLLKIHFQSFKKNLDRGIAKNQMQAFLEAINFITKRLLYLPDKILYGNVLTKSELCTKKKNFYDPFCNGA
jgi:hypothetical protein